MRNWSHIRNHVDANTECCQSANRRFTTRTRTLDFNVKVLDALIQSCTSGHFRCYLGSKRSGLARALETLTTGRRPRQSIALAIGNRDDGVVERCMHVCNTVCNILADFFANALRCIIGGSFCHGGFSIPVISSKTQQPYAGLCGYEHSCGCADHAWATHGDGGIRGSSRCPSIA